MLAEVKSKLQSLPKKSGVYIFKDISGAVIYIGKAVILANRVKSYFNSSYKDVKVLVMVEQIASIDYIITLSEKDALGLEANLVKKHKPRYNILLKDDKHAPYIRIDLKQDYPNVEIVRRVKNDGARYFGPYFFGIRVNEIVRVLKSAYRVRTCGKNYKNQQRACLNHDIELCLAPCQDAVTRKEYRAALDKAMAFLNGKDKSAQKILEQKMADAAREENFERAIFYREQLESVQKLSERIVADLKDDSLDIDAIYLSVESSNAQAAVVIVRGGLMLGAVSFALNNVLDKNAALGQFITQYYSNNNGDIPKEILLSEQIESGAFEEYLSALKGKAVSFSVPKIGAKKRLIDMAKENAEDALVKSVDKAERDYMLYEGASKELSQLLNIPNLSRIECYDISHVSGTDTVASGVCFIDGRAAKKDYRRYKIKSHLTNDDFLSLSEVLSRRSKRIAACDTKFGAMPDLIIIDGGKGQLSAAHAAMKAVGITIPMISLAKREEEVFTLDNPTPIILPKDSPALKLLQRIRDEAHRFAVSYHRVLRGKRLFKK